MLQADRQTASGPSRPWLAVIVLASLTWTTGRAAAAPPGDRAEEQRLDRECRQKREVSCYQLALRLQRRPSPSRSDLERARQLHDRACLRTHAPACFALSAMLARGQGGPRDEVKADLLFRMGENLQERARKAAAAERARRQSRATARAACDNGNPPACSDLGIMQVTGFDGPKDLPGARITLAKACTGGDAIACFVLARLHLDGEGGPRDTPAGRRLADQSCRLGLGAGCGLHAACWRSGVGGPRNAVEEKRWLRRACELGHGSSCVPAGLPRPAGPTRDPHPSLGPASAPVTVEVFVNLKDPFSVRALELLGQLARAHPRQARIVLRHLPTASMPASLDAANASIEVFRELGNDAFWRYLELLRPQRGGLEMSAPTYATLASAFGADITKVQQAVASGAHSAEIGRWLEEYRRRGIRGTPAFQIGKQLLLGLQRYETLDRLVRAAGR